MRKFVGMKSIVSANYRDRSKKNFLVRAADSSIEDYSVKDSVILKDFVFRNSEDAEAGFGCTIVAEGEIVEAADVDPASLIEIEFDLYEFVEVNSPLNRVSGGAFLICDLSGLRYARSQPVE